MWATTLEAFDGDTVVIPNAQLTNSVISNHTRRGVRRVTVGVGVEYGSDLSRARQVLGWAATRAESGLKQPEPDERLTSFG